MSEPSEPRVAYVVRSFPRLTQTFVLDEMLRVEAMDIPLTVFALARAHDGVAHADVGELGAPVTYLTGSRFTDHAAVIARNPWRYLKTVGRAALDRGHSRGYHVGSRWRCFSQAVALVRKLPRSVAHIHAHFAHDPTLVALLAHRLTGLPFTFTAHARDLYQVDEHALAARAHEAVAVVTCCRANADHLAPIASGKVRLVRHGVDPGRFFPGPRRPRLDVPTVISVARLVEKKGVDDLLIALGELARRGAQFRCVIVGDGPLRADLGDLAQRLGLDRAVWFPGAVPREALVAMLQDADIFALTPRVSRDGDRDGIPNSVLEAMACGLAVVATAVGGVTEAVHHERTGLIAAEGDVDGIASCLLRLLTEPALRGRLGRGARRAVLEKFDPAEGTRRLVEVFTPRRRPALKAATHTVEGS